MLQYKLRPHTNLLLTCLAGKELPEEPDVYSCHTLGRQRLSLKVSDSAVVQDGTEEQSIHVD